MTDIKNFQTWLREVMLKIIENLEQNVDEVRYELVNSTDNLMSTQHYVCLKFKNEKKEQKKELHIILKKPGDMGNIYRKIYTIDSQYHNEILFYNMYAQPEDNFARCFYANERLPVDSVIALENLSEKGYSPCPFLYNAPLEYTLAVMREMGRFHGKGYVMKELQREKFFDIVKRIEDVKFGKTAEYYKNFSNINATRAVDYLRTRGYDAVFCNKMEALLSKGYEQVMMKVVEPFEPLSTLCHGDLTLSNVLFKREDDGQHRALLIDFANLMYSMPVVDLSTYLCLCCFNEVSKNKFFDIIRAYHDTLKEYLLDAGIKDIEKYSYNALLNNYRRGSLFGFVIASCYLSTLLGHTNTEMHKTRNICWTEFAKVFKHAGGDEVSKILADILLYLKDLGCLKHVL